MTGAALHSQAWPSMALRVALVGIMALAAVHGVDDSVTSLDAVSKKVKLRLWTHIDGAPKGHPVELELPDGQNEDVQEIVSAKLAEKAAAELHHAKVKEMQLGQKSSEDTEVSKRSSTKNKLARTKWERLSNEAADAEKVTTDAQDASEDAYQKFVEVRQAYQFESKKEKEKLKDKLTKAKTAKEKTAQALQEARDKSKKINEELRVATNEKDDAEEQASHDHLTAVAARVKLKQAKHERERMEFEAMKTKQGAKLAAQKRTRENWKKKLKLSKDGMKRAQEYLEMMDSDGGKKAAQVSLSKATSVNKKAQQEYNKAKKLVTETSDKLTKEVANFKKTRAHRTFMSAAKAAQVVAQADKDFAAAVSEGDKASKAQTVREAQEELKRADDRARKNMAQYLNSKFLAKQEKTAEEAAMKEEEEEKKAKKEKLEEEKKEQELSKDALQDVGKPPKN